MSNPLFTIIKSYFQCCTNRCSFCYNNKDNDDKPQVLPSRIYTYNTNDDNSPLSSFDDVISPGTSGSPGTPETPMTWSSSSSSLESYKSPYPPYKRPQFKPFISIIPTNYYSD